MMASAAAALVLSASCGREERALYPGGEYIMFADSTAMYYMTDDPDDSFPVEVASTVACDYDRTYAIEFLAGESNAIEGVNFTIDSYNVEIPAGEMTGTVHLKGVFDSIEASALDVKLGNTSSLGAMQAILGLSMPSERAVLIR